MSGLRKRKRSDAVAAPGAPPGPGPGPAPAPNALEVQERPEPRKVAAACIACRKQKIKCDMPSEEPPCARCERKGLASACVLHTSALRNSNTDQKQIGLLSKDISNVYSTLHLLCNKLGVEPPEPLASAEAQVSSKTGQAGLFPAAEGPGNENSSDYEPGVYELSPPASPSTIPAPIDPYLSSGPLTNNSNAVNNAGPLSPSRRACQKGDLVTKGFISHECAESLVQRYLRHLDRFLYGIASQYQDADDVRKASPALFAAMCAVSAFQDVRNRELFEICYKEYRQIVSSSLFEKRDLEYIRALCIGSFWLLDASRILLSDAIRRAADTRLHQHFHRLAEQSKLASIPTSSVSSSDARASISSGEQVGDARDKLRLWYLLFVSDRHLSILHNRDALIRQEKDAIENRDSFLANCHTDSIPNSDIRLVSQVSLLVIMGQIRDVLGCERSRPLSRTFVIQFSHFSHDLDQWFEKYSPSFDLQEPDPGIGTFPLAGLTMHAHYARLYLSHHVFQGLDKDPIPVHFLPAAAASRKSAHDIFSLLLENAAFRDNIVGMPHYFHIMISFAGHFLLEVAMKHRGQLGISAQDDFDRVAAMLALYARATVMPQHPVARVLVGLTRKLKECTASLGVESILTGSPFENAEYMSLMTEFGGLGDMRTDEADHTLAPLNMQSMNGVPDDFLYREFGDFHLEFP